MAAQRARKSSSVARQSAELAMAVPQVVAHRMMRMALAGPVLSERDRREFQTMVTEKQSAFTQAWFAMAAESLRVNQALALSLFGSFFNPFASAKGPVQVANRMALDMQAAAMGVLGQGLKPVHRKASANAKRLAKTRLR